MLIDCQGSEHIDAGNPTVDTAIDSIGLRLSSVHILNLSNIILTNDITRIKVRVKPSQ